LGRRALRGKFIGVGSALKLLPALVKV